MEQVMTTNNFLFGNYMSKAYIRKNIKHISIILFLISFYAIIYASPSFLFAADGSVRHFGFGNTTRTVLPIWLIAGILGILSYMVVLYYIIS
jgi:uncharacterized protein with PQ loop repeat